MHRAAHKIAALSALTWQGPSNKQWHGRLDRMLTRLLTGLGLSIPFAGGSDSAMRAYVRLYRTAFRVNVMLVSLIRTACV